MVQFSMNPNREMGALEFKFSYINLIYTSKYYKINLIPIKTLNSIPCKVKVQSMYT